jgi:hypothetical protein
LRQLLLVLLLVLLHSLQQPAAGNMPHTSKAEQGVADLLGLHAATQLPLQLLCLLLLLR